MNEIASPEHHFSRRQFLQSAGGITFLALLPIGSGLFAARAARGLKPPPLPIFTALPYVQPGSQSALQPEAEEMRVVWQTEQTSAEFAVSFGTDTKYPRSATINRTSRAPRDAAGNDGRFNYVAQIDRLKLGRRYVYIVRCNGQTIAEGYFTTRQPRGQRIRFVAFGDNSYGDISDRAIAFQAYAAHPDFVMNTGDNVYNGGLDNEYARFFFPVYNADVAGVHLGAPLLRSVPFFSVLANHDVYGKNSSGQSVANFDQDADSLAYYTNFHLPLNGPTSPAQPTPIVGKGELLDVFRKCAGARFPRMANYSYDWGDAHFLCLDSNLYIDPTDRALQAWIETDLTATDATWKFVSYHHPAFNVGTEHYTQQHMRVLSPLFERLGVDFVLCGHEHNYQRTCPLKFSPRGPGKAANLQSKDRLVPGEFTVDRIFDGAEHRSPNGIIYLTTGAGGKQLYGATLTENPAKWLHSQDDNIEYVDRLIADRHSLTVFEIEGASLVMRQVDEFGQEIDRIEIEKTVSKPPGPLTV